MVNLKGIVVSKGERGERERGGVSMGEAL